MMEDDWFVEVSLGFDATLTYGQSESGWYADWAFPSGDCDWAGPDSLTGVAQTVAMAVNDSDDDTLRWVEWRWADDITPAAAGGQLDKMHGVIIDAFYTQQCEAWHRFRWHLPLDETS